MKLFSSGSTEGVMLAKRRHIEEFGRTLSFYIDFGGVFSVNVNNPDRDKITQFTRSCKELGIKVIYDYSPQAKGRVDRSNKTHQDRLIKELRLAGISDIAKANQFIKEIYLPRLQKVILPTLYYYSYSNSIMQKFKKS